MRCKEAAASIPESGSAVFAYVLEMGARGAGERARARSRTRGKGRELGYLTSWLVLTGRLARRRQ